MPPRILSPVLLALAAVFTVLVLVYGHSGFVEAWRLRLPGYWLEPCCARGGSVYALALPTAETVGDGRGLRSLILRLRPGSGVVEAEADLAGSYCLGAGYIGEYGLIGAVCSRGQFWDLLEARLLLLEPRGLELVAEAPLLRPWPVGAVFCGGFVGWSAWSLRARGCGGWVLWGFYPIGSPSVYLVNVTAADGVLAARVRVEDVVSNRTVLDRTVAVAAEGARPWCGGAAAGAPRPPGAGSCSTPPSWTPRSLLGTSACWCVSTSPAGRWRRG